MRLIGGKASAFFRRLPNPILANTQGLGDQPHIKDLIGTVKVMLDAYRRRQDRPPAAGAHAPSSTP